MTEKRKIYDDAFGMDPEDLEEKQPVNGLVPIYANVCEQMEKLNDSDRLKAYTAICRYGIFGEEPKDLPLPAYLVFTGTKPAIDNYYKRANGGKKGGRPKKKKEDPEDEDGEEHKETVINKPKVKTLGKNFSEQGFSVPIYEIEIEKEKEKEKDTEKDNEISFSCNTFSFKEPKAGNASAGCLPASVPGFSFDSCLQCRDDNSMDLTDEQVKQFYDWMTGNGWKINGQPVKILKNAMKGYAKKQNHSAGIVETFTDEARMKKTAPFYWDLYQSTKKVITAQKAEKLYRNIVEKFFTSTPAEQIEYLMAYEDSAPDPDSETYISDRDKWLKENAAELFYPSLVSDLIEKAAQEVVNQIPVDKLEDMSDWDIYEHVRQIYYKYFTADEMRYILDFDLIPMNY